LEQPGYVGERGLSVRLEGVSVELEAASGFLEPRLREEFPGLRLSWVTAEPGSRRSSRAVRQRLQDLSNRFHGASVVAMRTQAVPHAYRAFFRQIGLDPDVRRIPSEEAAVERLLKGGFQSRGPIDDARLIALLETGVGVWALDADQVDAGGLGIRTTISGEPFGSGEHRLPGGSLVVTDSSQVHALLFGAIAPGHAAEARTKRVVLFAVGVDGVPSIHVEEALWACADVLSAG
jgi:DNA/RNA-binding domain of Phe-tRNA-synthetase-like protein